MTSQKFYLHSYGMTNTEQQRPEGALIEAAAKAKGLSARKAADAAGISDARWRQIINGYASAGAGQSVTVTGPAHTLARMALAVGVTAEQLREAGRGDAADALLVQSGMNAESDWQNVGSALDRLLIMREQLDAVIADLSSSGGGSGGDTAPNTLDS